MKSVRLEDYSLIQFASLAFSMYYFYLWTLYLSNVVYKMVACCESAATSEHLIYIAIHSCNFQSVALMIKAVYRWRPTADPHSVTCTLYAQIQTWRQEIRALLISVQTLTRHLLCVYFPRILVNPMFGTSGVMHMEASLRTCRFACQIILKMNQ